MRNEWGVEKEPVVYWLGEVPRTQDAERLLAAVRAAGRDTGAWRDGGERDPSGKELTYVETSVVSVFDHDGDVVTRESSCVVAVPGPGPKQGHHPPLSVSLFDRAVVVDTATDLWFPRLMAGLDNSVLAAWNAPRLNAFLARVRAAVLDLGGTWMVEPVQGLRAARDQLDERGLVRVDAETPVPVHRWGQVRRNRWGTAPVARWVASLPAAPIEEHWDFATFVEMAGDDTRAYVVAGGRVRVFSSLLAVVDEHGVLVDREVGCLADLPGSRGCHKPPIEVTYEYGPGDPMTMRATVSLWVEVGQARRLGGFLAFLRQETEDRGGTWTGPGLA